MSAITKTELSAALAQHSLAFRGLERKVRTLTGQRDAANGRLAELRGYVARYQKEIAALKKDARK